MTMGLASRPVSSSQWQPVISPAPLKRKTPAWQASRNQSLRGRMVVAPVLTWPSAERMVSVCTSTPGTSVRLFLGPGGQKPRWMPGTASLTR